MQTYLIQADCVIAHGEYGITTGSIKRQKCLLVVRRQKELRQCLDYQFEIAEYLRSDGLIAVVRKYCAGDFCIFRAAQRVAFN